MKRANIDARGKTCPWPVILMKEKLQTLKSGDILDVTVDYCPSKENVERVAKSMGNKVLETKKEKTFFTISIEKK